MDITEQLEEERRLAAKVLSSHTPYDPIGTQKLADALPLRNAQVQAVLALHKPETDVHGYQVCGFRYCYDGGEHVDQHAWPCPTIRAIEEAGA